jgi:hypothetical protein
MEFGGKRYLSDPVLFAQVLTFGARGSLGFETADELSGVPFTTFG